MNLQKPGGEHTIDVDLLPQAPLVLDVGCRDFGFDIGILSLRPEARIIAFDPDPLIQVPKDSRIEFHQKAVTEQKIDKVIWQGPGEGAYIAHSKTGYGHGVIKQEHSAIVDNITLSDLDPFFDLVKLDCEGSEFGILENWPGPIATQISVEFHDCMNVKRWNDEYFQKLFSGPLKDYKVVLFGLTPIGPKPTLGHWDSLLVLR